MRVKIVLMIVLIVLIMQNVLAIQTQINVKTLPYHKASIFVLDSSQVYYLLNSTHKNSESIGIVSFSYSGSQNTINIRVRITDSSGKEIINEKFDGFNTGNPIYLQVIPGNISTNYKEFEKNVTLAITNQTNVTTTTANITNANQSEIKTTGSVISLKNIISSTIVYYIVGGILLIAITVFAVFWIRNHRDSFNSKTASNIKLDKDNSNRALLGAERKIKELQSEINRLKAKDRIEEIERKIEEERKEVDKLKRFGVES